MPINTIEGRLILQAINQTKGVSREVQADLAHLQTQAAQPSAALGRMNQQTAADGARLQPGGATRTGYSNVILLGSTCGPRAIAGRRFPTAQACPSSKRAGGAYHVDVKD
jgi:hypothetical protein